MKFMRENQQPIPKTTELLRLKIQKILDLSGDGLVVYLADEDFSNHRNSRYHDIAFYMNIETGGIEECSPQDIISIMEDPNIIHFIWLSNCWKRGDIFFAWLYAHELKHLKQDIDTPNISVKTKQLWELYRNSNCSNTNQYYQHDLPVEYDADLVAKYIIERLFSKKQVDDFFNLMISDGKRANSFRHLQTIDGTLCYDYNYQTDNLTTKLS